MATSTPPATEERVRRPQGASQQRHEQWRTLLRAAAQVGIGIVVVLEAIDEVRALRRRAHRAAGRWWDGVHLRDQRRLHRREITLLSRVLRPQ